MDKSLTEEGVRFLAPRHLESMEPTLIVLLIILAAIQIVREVIEIYKSLKSLKNN